MGRITNMSEMKWDMWVMGINLTNQSGLWWVPWFPYNGDQWWSRNSPSVPTESSLPMPRSSAQFASTSSSLGSFVWRESSHNCHRFVGARHDLSRPYPSSEDVYLRSNQYVHRVMGLYCSNLLWIVRIPMRKNLPT